MHRISNPASHLQRRAHKSEVTNEQSPGTDVILKRAHLVVTHPKAAEKGGRWGRRNPWFGRTWMGSQPPQPWKECRHRHPNVGYQHSRAYLNQKPTSSHYIRASTHPLNGSILSHSHTQGGKVVVVLHLYQ